MSKMSSKASYRIVPYNVRPRKWIERKMIVESLPRLQPFDHVENYTYVGFGSPFFTDFVMFHKSLGIKKMVNIEENVDDRERFEFNKPFNNITLEFGSSSDKLPDLNWEDHHICWLDYDVRLKEFMLDDIQLLLRKCRSGSMIMVSFNCNELYKALDVAPKETDADGKLKDKFANDVDRKRVPHDMKLRSLKGWGTGDLYYRLVQQAVAEEIALRNKGLEESEHFSADQIFHFRYKDNAKMMTIGWLLSHMGHSEKAMQCGFTDLSYCKMNSKAFEITAPLLTRRELRYLDASLPGGTLTDVDWLDFDEIQAYKEVYRHYPNLSMIEE